MYPTTLAIILFFKMLKIAPQKNLQITKNAEGK
jgi:hypothetical protein